MSDIPEPRFQDSLEYKTDRRNSIAENFAYALVASGQYVSVDNVAHDAVSLSDALIAHLDANPPKGEQS